MSCVGKHAALLFLISVHCTGELQPMLPLWGPAEGGTYVSFNGISSLIGIYSSFSCNFGGSLVPASIVRSNVGNAPVLGCTSPKPRFPGAVPLKVIGNNSAILNSFSFYYFGILNLRPLSGVGGTVINILIGGFRFPNDPSLKPVCYFSVRSDSGDISVLPQSSNSLADSQTAQCRFSAAVNRSDRCVSVGKVLSSLQSRISCNAPLIQNSSQCSMPGCAIHVDVSLDGGQSFTQEQRPFLYLPGVSIRSVSLSSAPFEGGTAITVYGSNFDDVPELTCR